MNGPLRVLLNEGTTNNYVKVVMPDSVRSLGARVIVEGGEVLTKYFIPGTGFMTDQSPELIFGLGEYEGDVKVTVEWLSGEVEVFNVEVNSKVVV